MKEGREKDASFSFNVTNKEINKSLWAFDRLPRRGGAVTSSWNIHEAVVVPVCVRVCDTQRARGGVHWLVSTV